MKKENRILALIDLTEHSKNLMDFAYRFSECIDARIVFVHQVLGMVPGIADQESRDEIIRVEKEHARAKMRQLARESDGRKDIFYVSEKRIPTILQELKRNQYFDWVIAGLKSTGMLKRIFIGSTTLSIIDDTDFLTVAIPFSAPVPIPEKLMVGVTHKFPLNKPQFDGVLASLGKQIKEVTFFTILEDDKEEEKAMANLTQLQEAYADYPTQVILAKGQDAFTTLKSQVAHQDTFLVVQQGSRTLTDQLLRKFMINELVYTGLTPLIVISK